MTEQFAAAMHQAVSETFENMAFLAVEPVSSAERQEVDILVASLLMHDPCQGEFRLLMPRDLLLQVAEALFALPVEELNDQLIEDTLSELLNTIAGRFLNEVLPGSVYQLGLPEQEDPAEGPLDGAELCWHYRTEEAFLTMAVSGATLMAEAK